MSGESPHTSPSRTNPRFKSNGREKLLKAKEIQLREHELELVQYERQMTEMYEQLALWRDQCVEALKTETQSAVIPDMPPTLQKLDKMRKKTPSTSSTSTSSINQEDEELMLLIEESTKTTKEKAAIVNGKLKELSEKPGDDQSLPTGSSKQPLNLIEPLTKPPKKVSSEFQGKSNPHLVDKKVQTLKKSHKKCSSISISNGDEIQETIEQTIDEEDKAVQQIKDKEMVKSLIFSFIPIHCNSNRNSIFFCLSFDLFRESIYIQV